MNRLLYYWNRTKTTMKWSIAYRERKESDILSDKVSPFHEITLEKGTWGADPFLLDYHGRTYLFYELYLEDENKGVIACTDIENGTFDKNDIIIEEDYHLSFPCVFKIGDDLYLIPESGSQHTITLYRCICFPNKWEKVKVLADNIDSSDTIVYQNKDGVFLIASVLKGNPSTAYNIVYMLDPEKFELVELVKNHTWGNDGYRNAGLLFESNQRLYRPGQNCPENQYGKGLTIWQVNELNSNVYSESKYVDIDIEQLIIEGNKQYQGLHTYNQSDKYEVIDLKTIIKTSLFRRIVEMVRIMGSYLSTKRRN